MEKQQELEWIDSQNIMLSKDLVSAAKQQLKFLDAVDKNAQLYDGPALDYAIYRYKNHWLPLLAKFTESRFQEGLLVVPLDCEWIWHCHRLNPVQYMNDCKELYGTVLDNKHVVSSVSGSSTSLTEEIWNLMYPDEPYMLNNVTSVDGPKLGVTETTTYDLVSAVKRQSSFYYQVSRPYMNDDLFLEEAVARYKGFLHLIKKNKKNDDKHFYVPTYDIDLIWHSHQLHPHSYLEDSMATLGEILEHDDTDSDRTKGKKLDVGFRETIKCWEQTFGSRYLKAGVTYRGSPTKSLVLRGHEPNSLPRQYVEVLIEIVEAKNLPDGHGESLFLSIKKHELIDPFFKTKGILNVFPKPKDKQILAFECAPTGEIVFELISAPPRKILGTTLISLEDLFNPLSSLLFEKWFEFLPSSANELPEKARTSLRIALSFTPPVKAGSEHFKDSHQVLDNTLNSEGGACSGSGGGGCGGGCSGNCGGGCSGNCGGGSCRSK